MKLFALTIFAVCVSASSAFAGIGLPKPSTCQNTSSGEFLYSVQTEIVGDKAVSTVQDQAVVSDIANTLAVQNPSPEFPFNKLELTSRGPNCQSNDNNPFALRCHPELEFTFISDTSGARITTPVSFASLWPRVIFTKQRSQLGKKSKSKLDIP